MAIARLQRGVVQSIESIENWLEFERDQLALWVPVMFGLGIGLWFWMDTVQAWIATIVAGLGCAFAGIAARFERRFATALLCGGLCMASGCGLIFSGMSPDGRLPEIVEVKDHPWYIGVQFHPELKSKPFAPHPLFADFVKAAVGVSRLV